MSAVLQTPAASAIVVKCNRCETTYEPLSAEWCSCDRATRSLLCPVCRTCFCDAPAAFRRLFWSAAPAALRQHPRRFSADKVAFPTAVRSREVAENAPVVVIADDDEAIRSLVACYVESLGYRTRITSDPHEAFDLAQASDVRVLITDALMPQMDGRELCRKLKSTRAGARKKVILMTSLYTARHFRPEAFRQFGVDEYLCKPVDLRLVGQALAKFAPLVWQR